MKEMKLKLVERVGLVNFLARATGPLGKMAALQRVFLSIRMTDAEVTACSVTDQGNGTSRIVPPSPEFGGVDVLVEEQDAQVLGAEIDRCETFTVADLDWVNAVKAQLGAPSIAAKKRGK